MRELSHSDRGSEMNGKENSLLTDSNIAFLVCSAFLVLLFFLARSESREEAREAQIKCIRAAQEIAAEEGAEQGKYYEAECLHDFEQDRMR